MLAILRNRDVRSALISAALFGAGTPLAKVLLGEVNPRSLAGLLYCGSGLGLSLVGVIRHSPRCTPFAATCSRLPARSSSAGSSDRSC